ncbi:MAG: CPBP family intramembrane metalloprotease [Clostridia bacterium]|nr:CPBP family intramembrane metalloprotease [Clostridia bacterium]
MENKALKITGRIFASAGIIAASLLWLNFACYIWTAAIGAGHYGWKGMILEWLNGRSVSTSFSLYTILAVPPLVAYLLFVSVPEAVYRIVPGRKRMPLWYNIPAFVLVLLSIFWNFQSSGVLKYTGIVFPRKADLFLKEMIVLIIPVLVILCMLPPAAAKIVELCRTRCRHVPRNLLLSSARICFLILIAYIGTIAALFLSNCFAPYSFVQSFCRKNATSAILAFVSLVCAPIGEEIAFRGVMCRSLSRRATLWPALLFSALLFGIWHRNIPQFVYTVPMGIIFGYAYMMTGKLRHSILMHFVNNLIAILAFSEGPSAVFGEHPQLVALCKTLFDFPTALSAVYLVVCFAIIVVCFWAIHLLQKALAPQNQI